jgi:glycosyltransferase involved in cell wall biosynthesis
MSTFPLLSICIPTFNRAKHLLNCLASIAVSGRGFESSFEVCVSDNNSADNTEEIVKLMQEKLKIKYVKNVNNIGRVRNYLNVVEMADSAFVWMIGDDDIILENAINDVVKLILKYNKVDYFYVNSFQLNTEYVMSFEQPFDTKKLPENMERFSKYTNTGEMEFLKLIDPKISFDFLGGMFLGVFRRKNWRNSKNILNDEAIDDTCEFSHFDNTFPHLKIFSEAFAKSQAYFYATPVSVNLSGAREWSVLYPLVRTVRLIEALDEYMINGMSFFRYTRCKNFTLRYFIPDMVYLILNKDNSGYQYVNIWKILRNSIFYPNAWFSVFYYFINKVAQILHSKKST